MCVQHRLVVLYEDFSLFLELLLSSEVCDITNKNKVNVKSKGDVRKELNSLFIFEIKSYRSMLAVSMLADQQLYSPDLPTLQGSR